MYQSWAHWSKLFGLSQEIVGLLKIWLFRLWSAFWPSCLTRMFTELVWNMSACTIMFYPPLHNPLLWTIRNGETIRKTVRPRSCVIPVNGNGSSIGALAGSQMQLAFSAWLNGVLSNSHLAVNPSIQELLMVSMCAYLCERGMHHHFSVHLFWDMQADMFT